LTIYLYILRQYLKYVIGTIVLTVFLFVLFDFIHKTTKDFLKNQPSAFVIAKYYLFQIPNQVVQSLPIAALLASVICMILLSRTNEITAMRAVGMGPLRIGLPLATGGLILSLFSALVGELLVPQLAQKVAYIRTIEIEKRTDEVMTAGTHWFRDGQVLINFQDYEPLSQTLIHLKLLQVGNNFKPMRSTEASTARYIEQEKVWWLKGVRAFSFGKGDMISKLEPMADFKTTLPVEPTKLQRDLRKPNELSIQELYDTVSLGEKSGLNTLPYKVDFHGKIAYPFAAFVVSLIGLKFGYKSERTTETAKGMLLAFFIGISYWFILSSGRALGLRGDIPPVVAAWLPNVVIFSITLIDALRGRKN